MWIVVILFVFLLMLVIMAWHHDVNLLEEQIEELMKDSDENRKV